MFYVRYSATAIQYLYDAYGIHCDTYTNTLRVRKILCEFDRNSLEFWYIQAISKHQLITVLLHDEGIQIR